METEIIKTKGTSCRTKVSTRFASERIMMSHFSFLKTPVFILLKNKIREDNLTDSRRGAHMDKIQRETDYAVGKNQREKPSENADKNPARNCPVHVHIKGVAAYQEKGGGD